VNHGLREADALPVSLGHLPDVFVTDGFETADVHHLLDPLLHGVPRSPWSSAGELKGVEGIHIEIQRIHLREIADFFRTSSECSLTSMRRRRPFRMSGAYSR